MQDLAPPKDAFGRLVYRLSVGWALLGGLALVLIASLTTLNSVLKKLTGGHVPGEYEIAEVGVAMVTFTFLPLAQLTRSYLIVDVFTQRASPRLKSQLDAVAGLVFALCVAVLVWRMGAGGFDIASTGERTAQLHLPYWWAFAVAVPSLALLAAACVHSAWFDWRTSRS
jgi:TRAP-type C4-dicarboxylate transport system permease small subunit